MSMKVLTILQFTGALAAYLIMTVLLPAVVFYRKVKMERMAARFLIYSTIGNFYMMNLVFALELLHISNRFTLIFFTAAPAAAAFIKLNGIPVRARAARLYEYARRMAAGTMGGKELARRTGVWIGNRLYRVLCHTGRLLRGHMIEWLLLAGLTVFLIWIYGTNLIETFGYCASDIPVHNYWINYLGKNQIFVAGVYPFGFHCVIYYLHEVFFMDTYVLLRVFCLVQVLMVHYMLFVFLKVCCKTKFAPYLGTWLYAAGAFYNRFTYTRYYSSLPQEFGMLFILPSVYFLFAFFRSKNCEIKGEPVKHRPEWYLAGFSLSFSMTLAVHFYNTMIAGLFCLGIAAGFAFRLFRKKYFGKVILAGLLSIVIAVLPMGIAFATGTPLQGSLKWGMNIIKGEDKEEQKEEQQKEEEQKEETDQKQEGVQQEGQDGTGQQEPQEGQELQGGQQGTQQEEAAAPGLKERVINKLNQVLGYAKKSLEVIISQKDAVYVRESVFGGIALLFLLGILFLLFRRRDYGGQLLSVSFFMVLMFVLSISGAIGIPELMDMNRCGIFFAYMTPLLWAFGIDGVLYLLLGWMKHKQLMQLLSFACLAASVVFLNKSGWIKEPAILGGLQTNEAVTCLTNIIRDNPDNTWTICSANDELRMGEDHGFHYETIDFLRKMERSGAGGMLTIPTHKVYFYIEKIPMDYTVAYEGSGQSVSAEGASKDLPKGKDLGIYQAENRWIVMSRMYFWAEKFREMYPNEMKVYYETDNFICYTIEQNDYRLFNFAIDYGFNVNRRM